jgi:molybdopterin molybdotransferase
VFDDYGITIDTHTADGIKVAREHLDPKVPMIVLETALAAKFNETILEALGSDAERPAGFEDIETLPQRFVVMHPNVAQMKEFIAAHTGTGSMSALAVHRAGAQAAMLTVRQALDFLLGAASPLAEIELVDTLEANGRVLAEDQLSTLDVPGADNTQMDGYAVRAADCAGGAARLRVSQRIPAGAVGQPLEPGTAARIFTGAMMPSGADAVVMQEQCELEGDTVTVRHAPQAGEWIRRAGEDVRAGSVILAAGTRLRSQELGLAASVGLARLPVRRRLRVAVFFTGDELAMPGEALKPGAIYNSNRFTLRGLLENLGCDFTDYGIVPDALAATRATLRAAAQEHDLIITSGGVSVGEEDHIKPAVEAEGRLDMWQIAVKPGKPLAFGEVRVTAAAAPSSSACRAIRCRASSPSCCSCGLSCCACRA